MTEEQMKTLNRGDIITHISGESYVVLFGWPHIVAVREIHVASPSEWELFSRNPREREEA